MTKKSEPAVEFPENKTQFIRSILEQNPKAPYKDVVTAWEEAGYPADKAPASPLFYQCRRKLGLTKRRKKKVAKEKNTNVHEQLISIESHLDELVTLATTLKDKALTEALRSARRRVAKKLVA